MKTLSRLVTSVAALLGAVTAALLLGEARGDVLSLKSGGRIEGKVVKRTEELVFVDIGSTILAIPAQEVKEILPSAAAAPQVRASADPPAARAPAATAI